MVIDMSVQPYCMVDTATNICENVVLWDGNPDTWTPPADHLMLVQASTAAKIWEYDATSKSWSLGVQMGAGQIGFTWDGTYLTTNEPEPTPVVAAADQPSISGAQTL